MELTGQRTIPAPIGVTWQALNDPDILKACIPGCESLDRTGADALTAVLALRIGPVSARFKGNVKLDAVQPPTRYAIAFEGQGGMAGFGKGTADVTLTEQGTSTRLDYTARAQVGGRLAQVGSRLVDAAAQKLAEEFFSAFEKNVQPAVLEKPVVPAPPIQATPTARAMPVWVRIVLVVAACVALIVLAFGSGRAHAAKCFAKSPERVDRFAALQPLDDFLGPVAQATIGHGHRRPLVGLEDEADVEREAAIRAEQLPVVAAQDLASDAIIFRN